MSAVSTALSGRVSSATSEGTLATRRVRQLLWVYITLLFLEGPMRKWVIPSAADYLLLIRDPVVVVMYAYALRAGLFTGNRYLAMMFALGTVMVVESLLVDSSILPTTLYGWRTDFMHIPVAIFMARTFNADDLRKLFKVLMGVCFVDALFVATQYFSPPHSWINSGLDDTFTQIGGLTGDLIRPPGLFSFNTGPSVLGAVTLAFAMAPPDGLTGRAQIWRYFGLFGVVVALLFSASRHHWLLLLGVMVCVAGIGPFISVQSLRRTLPFLIGLVVVGGAAVSMPSVTSALSVFYESRLSRGGEVGGDTGSRLIQIFTTPLAEGWQQGLWGHGLGIGTQVGAKLANVPGSHYFGDAESDLNRHFVESGIIFGAAYLTLRIGTALCFIWLGIRASRGRNVLPLGLAGATASIILADILGQATVLGFAVIGAGSLLLAARIQTEGVVAKVPGWKSYRHTYAPIGTTQTGLTPLGGGGRGQVQGLPSEPNE